MTKCISFHHVFYFYFSPDPRRKWAGLRDYFLKCHKQLTRKPESAGGTSKKKWYLYNSMLFLLPYVSTDQKICSIKLSHESDDEVGVFSNMPLNCSFSTPGASNSRVKGSLPTPDFGVSQEGDDCDLKMDVHDADSSSSSDSLYGFSGAQLNTASTADTNAQLNTTSTADTKSKKRRFPQETQEQNPRVNDILGAIISMSSKPIEKSNDDEDELFLRSLAPKLKLLDPLLKLQCQADMQMVLVKYIKQQATNAPPDLDLRVTSVQPRQFSLLRNPHTTTTKPRQNTTDQKPYST